MGSKKKEVKKAKEAIRLRLKPLAGTTKETPIKDGNWSYYLDYYKDGVREYEFLKLYLIPEITAEDKQKNVNTKSLAEKIQTKRLNEFNHMEHGFSISKDRSAVKVIDYIKSLAEKKRIKTGFGRSTTAMSYLTLAKHIEVYSGRNTTFKQIDKKYCNGFIDYMNTAQKKDGVPLYHNTQVAYISFFIATLNTAIADEIITINPFDQIKPENKPKKQQNEIIYLTIEEIKILENTQGISPYIKQAFLFSCYTGLRFSDIKDLTWGMIQKDNNGEILIKYRVKKTDKPEELPMPQKAVKLLPDKGTAKDTDKIFSLPSNMYANLQLKAWAEVAGIKKHLTFHVARHTYATILLSLGASMEVISKNLAHSDLKITQVHYAAIQNKQQRAAVNLFDKLDGLTEKIE